MYRHGFQVGSGRKNYAIWGGYEGVATKNIQTRLYYSDNFSIAQTFHPNIARGRKIP